MAEQLTSHTPDLDFQGSSLTHQVLSLHKELYSICLSSPKCINGYQQHTARGNPAMK